MPSHNSLLSCAAPLTCSLGSSTSTMADHDPEQFIEIEVRPHFPCFISEQGLTLQDDADSTLGSQMCAPTGCP